MGPAGPQGPAGTCSGTCPTPPPPTTTSALIIGASYAENPADYPALKAKGLTHVHVWAQPNSSGTTARLDAAHAAGLKVWLDINWVFEGGVYRPERRAGMMDPYKTHPALAGWYAYDEPNWGSGFSVSNVATYYNALKAADPNHPVITTMAFGQSTSGAQFLPYLDQRWWDYYPIPAGPAEWFKGHFLTWLSATAAGAKPAGGVVQTFSWGNTFPEYPGRMPTVAEVQTMAVDAVLAQGNAPVKSVIFYKMDGSLRADANLWNNLGTITAAMRAAAGVPAAAMVARSSVTAKPPKLQPDPKMPEDYQRAYDLARSRKPKGPRF
jgi:hypothetical protein